MEILGVIFFSDIATRHIVIGLVVDRDANSYDFLIEFFM